MTQVTTTRSGEMTAHTRRDTDLRTGRQATTLLALLAGVLRCCELRGAPIQADMR